MYLCIKSSDRERYTPPVDRLNCFAFLFIPVSKKALSMAKLTSFETYATDAMQYSYTAYNHQEFTQMRYNETHVPENDSEEAFVAKI